MKVLSSVEAKVSPQIYIDVECGLTRMADGSINIWHKNTANLIVKLNGHIPGCNSVSWNPADPCLFASCGDDGKIKMYILFPR